MLHGSDVLVRVHESWSDWRSAEIRFADLDDVHWWHPSGAPHRLIHAFVRCTDLQKSDLQHRCDASKPHRFRVCVLKHFALASIYRELARRADQRGTVLSATPTDSAFSTRAHSSE